MKTISVSVSSVLLMVFSLTIWANKILIHTKPALLKPNLTYFSLPPDYTFDMNKYHYVIIAGERRVCYPHPQNTLASLDMLYIHLEVMDKQSPWYCYRYDPRFFEIDY